MNKNMGDVAEMTVARDGLGDLVRRVEVAFENENFTEVRTVISEDILGAWFAFPLDRLVKILSVVISKQPEIQDFFNHFFKFISSLGTEPDKNNFEVDSVEGDHQLEWLNQLSLIFSLRMTGRTKEAYEILKSDDYRTLKMSSIFEKVSPVPLFTALQDGLTAMLAGDQQFALAKFNEARMREAPAKYSFFLRDALSKSAVIHAAFGDQTLTKNLIEAAESIEPGETWVEPIIEAQIELSKISLLTDRTEALERLSKVDLRNLGEIWPFYILMVQKNYEMCGRRKDGESHLAMLEDFPLPRVDGQGLNGSVFAIVNAENALRWGNGSEARNLLTKMDPDILPVKIVSAMIEIYTGRPAQGVETLLSLRAEVKGLRHLAVRRLAYLSTGFFVLQNKDECLETLLHTIKEYPDLNESELLHFLPEVHSFAMKEVEGWPIVALDPDQILAPQQEITQQLSAREIEILKLLAKNMTRAQISKKLFISQNTVKSQTSAVYRKLGVSNKLAAIFEAERRALLD